MRAAFPTVERAQPTRKSKSAAVAAQLSVAIQGGEHGSGDKRLSECKLTEEPGVTRITIRALQLPEIVSNLPEQGPFVGSITTNGEMSNFVDPSESTATVRSDCKLDRSSIRQQPAERPAPGPTRARPSRKMLFSG